MRMFRQAFFASAVLIFALLFKSVLADSPQVVLATVNGETISQEDYNAFLGSPAEMKQVPYQPAIIHQLVDRELIVQDALDQGLDKDASFVNILETLEYNALVNFGMQKYFERHPITEERLREEYQKFGPLKQYQIRHIVVNTKRESEALIKKIRAGGNFAKLAAQYSMDPATRPRGGSLGWLTEEQMLEPVTKAVVNLSKGAVTKEPVKTQAGWHVILLEGVREQPPLPYEAAKGQLMMRLRQQQTVDYVDRLKKGAEIVIIE